MIPRSKAITSEQLNLTISRPSSNAASRKIQTISFDKKSSQSSFDQEEKKQRGANSEKDHEEQIDKQSQSHNETSKFDNDEQEDDTYFLFINAIDSELQRQIDKSRCVTYSNSCSQPNFKVKRITVALYNLHQLFPDIDIKELRYQIKLRMPHLNEDVLCCMQCYHIYLAFERCYLASKKSDTMTFERKPKPFQPLVQSELYQLRKMPIDSISSTKNQAHSFALNIVNSPYQDAGFPIPKPAKTKNKKKIKVQKNSQSSLSNSRPKTSVPKWVSRLTSDEFDALSSPKLATRSSLSSSLMKYRAADYSSIPYYQTPIEYSEYQAVASYYPMPFDRSKFEPDQKRKMMSRKISRGNTK